MVLNSQMQSVYAMIESKQPGYAIMFSTDHQRKSGSRINSRASQAKRNLKFFSRLSELERTLNTLNLRTEHNSFNNKFSQCRVSFPMTVTDLD